LRWECLIQTFKHYLKSVFFGVPKEKKLQPPQHQARQPGREYKMRPRPRAEDEKQRGSGKLQNKIALITGGDSGIGRAVAIAFAKEGANVAAVYLEEHKDAKETERIGRRMGTQVFANRWRHWPGKNLPKSSRSNWE
jgi:hypothetical protein